MRLQITSPLRIACLLVLCLAVVSQAATKLAIVPPDPALSKLPEAKQVTYIYDKAARWSPWYNPPEHKYSYLVQEPPKIADDAPILVYMHIAGATEKNGMALTDERGATHDNWVHLRQKVLERGWIYVSPEAGEFDGLEIDLLKRYGKRTIYLMGGSWGGLNVFLQARYKLEKDPKAYGGVALLASAIQLQQKQADDDSMAGAVIGKDFPVPVYLAVGPEAKIGGAMFKLYQHIADAGGTVRMDIFKQGAHPPISYLNWDLILDMISGKNTGEHSMWQWTAKGKKVSAEQIDPLPKNVTVKPELVIAPEPTLRKTTGGNFWDVEPLVAYPKDTPMVIMVPEKIPGAFIQGFGLANSRGKAPKVIWVSSVRIFDLRLFCFNAGWPYIVTSYVVPKGADAASQLKAIENETGPRAIHLVGIASGSDLAIELAKCDIKSVHSLILFHPSVDQIKAVTAMTCPAVITTATDCTAEQTGAARAFTAAAKAAKRSAIWISSQGSSDIAKGPATEFVDIADVIKRLEKGGVQELQCGKTIGSLSDAKIVGEN